MHHKKLREKRSLRKRIRSLRLKEGLWKRLLRGLPVLLLTILLTLFLVRIDRLHGFAADSQDLLLHLSGQPAGGDSKVVVVMIDDEDYESGFKKNGALDPSKLHELIDAIEKGNPALIGVDINTSDDRYRNFQIADWMPNKLVWVREVAVPVTEIPIPRDVLGGMEPRLNYDPHSGLPVLYEVNKVTRLYQREIETTEGVLSSFPWAVVKKFRPGIASALRANTNRLMIRFAGAKYDDFSASQILKASNESWWANNKEIRGKIVLIGVSYLGQDLQQTPLGELHGVHNMAAAIQTELGGGGIEQPNEFALLPLWILEGVLLVLVFQFFPLQEALLQNLAWSLVLILGTSLICSLIASRSLTYSTLTYLAYFLPVGILVFIEQLRDLLNDWRKKRIKKVYSEVSSRQR